MRPGDDVVLNATAVALGLGTGGMHLVVAVLPLDAVDVEGSGHVMKARYTPLQVAVQTVEETDRDALEASPGLGGTPVVAAPLHSMVAAIAAGAKVAGAKRVAYAMTDGASLPGALSRLIPLPGGAGLLDGWITCGQAFGGELEAVTVWTGLLAAVELMDAEIVIVADGPGTSEPTPPGASALGSGHTIDAAEELGGRPVGGLRVSFADRRERHRGLAPLPHDPRPGVFRPGERRRPRARGRGTSGRGVGRCEQLGSRSVTSSSRSTAGPRWTSLTGWGFSRRRWGGPPARTRRSSRGRSRGRPRRPHGRRGRDRRRPSS